MVKGGHCINVQRLNFLICVKLNVNSTLTSDKIKSIERERHQIKLFSNDKAALAQLKESLMR